MHLHCVLFTAHPRALHFEHDRAQLKEVVGAMAQGRVWEVAGVSGPPDAGSEGAGWRIQRPEGGGGDVQQGKREESQGPTFKSQLCPLCAVFFL